MANQYISTKRTEQGALAASGSTLVPCVDSGVSTVHTVDELATAIGGYTVPALVQSAVRCAKVTTVDDIGGGTYTTPNVYAWTSVEFDNGGWWAVGVPQRLTVPAGVTKVSVSLSVHKSDTTTVVSILKNGSLSAYARADGTGYYVNLTTGTLEVVPGDYFEMYLDVGTGSLIESPLTWFSITEVERTA